MPSGLPGDVPFMEASRTTQSAGPADGWLTQDALWLVSKTVADKLRAHLLSQGVDGMNRWPWSRLKWSGVAWRSSPVRTPVSISNRSPNCVCSRRRYLRTRCRYFGSSAMRRNGL